MPLYLSLFLFYFFIFLQCPHLYICIVCMYIWLNCIYLYLNVYCQCLMLTVCTKGLRVTQFQFSVCMYCTCGRIDNKADLTWLDLIKEPRTTSKELQASLASIKVSVHDLIIRKDWAKNGIHGRVPRQKPLLTKKNTKAHLTFAKKISWLSPRLLGKYSVDWWDKSWTFGRCVSRYIWCKTNTAFHKRTSYQQSKHGGGSVMVWGCFAASGPGWLAIIDGTMNSALYQKILKENVSLWPQAQAHLGYAAGQWSQTHQQVHLWMAPEKQN